MCNFWPCVRVVYERYQIISKQKNEATRQLHLEQAFEDNYLDALGTVDYLLPLVHKSC
jgi:hypothetical protein